MGVVTKLSAEVISHIAAGQVIERPVSVVKELLENALDAQAKNILIRLEDGGKKKIAVTDDGCGMSKEDLLLAIEPHATSKITTVSDLGSITSFGFRGEALASIAQSALLSIQSKTSLEKTGTKIVLEKGIVVAVSDVGMLPGTIVVVEDLFVNLPARKKFLKSAQAEFQAILELVTALALAHPSIGIQLFNNDKVICDYLPNQSLSERVVATLGKKAAQYFLPISFSLGSYQLDGLLGTPQAAAEVSQRQILFVNKRLVGFLPLSKAVKRVFGSLLPPTILPPFILFISAPPDLIDVNTHPKKEKIAFAEQEIILSLVAEATKKTLDEADITFRYLSGQQYILQDSGMDAGTAQVLRTETGASWNVKNYFATEPVLQLKKLYLLAESEAGLLLIDQHAAHERILYEEFLTAFESEKKNLHVIKLSKPQVIELPVLEAELFFTHQDIFSAAGFSWKRLSDTSFSIEVVPRLFKTRALSKYILEVLEDIRDNVPVPDLDMVSHRAIAYLACRTAIKAGEVLTQTERHNLVEKLLATRSNFTCPHGRPVLVVMNHHELAQLFHRIPASRNEK